MARTTLFVLVGLAATVSAQAAVVTFVNTNPAFAALTPYIYDEFEPRFGQALDIRSDSFSQPAPLSSSPPAGMVMFEHRFGATSTPGEVMNLYAGLGVRIASHIVNDKNDQIYGFDPDTTGDIIPVEPPHRFGVGDTVDADWNWVTRSPVWGLGGDVFQVIPLLQQNNILGIELTLDTGVHYGFVELEQLPLGSIFEAPTYRAVRWGWETQAGVALVIPPIPAPGGAPLLACAALGVIRRRR